MITPAYGMTATERVLPRLALNFLTGVLDPRIAFARSGNTATVVGSNGYITSVTADTPRFEYDPETLQIRGLFIEETRTNYVVNSSNLAEDWTGTGPTGTKDYINLNASLNTSLAPDNTTTAGTFSPSVSGGRMTIIHNDAFCTTKNQDFTASIFVKAGTSSTFKLDVVCQTNGTVFSYRSFATFNLANGTASAVTNIGVDGLTPAGVARIQAYKDGWYRCSVSFKTYNGANALNAILVELRPNASNTGGTNLFWQPQDEIGSFATSLIKTSGTIETRNADLATMSGTNFSNWYNATEGAIFTESVLSRAANVQSPIIFLGTGATAMTLRYRSTAVTGFLVENTSIQADLSSGSAIASNQVTRSCAAYKENNFAYSTDAAALALDTSGTVPTVSVLNLGYNAGSEFLNGYLRKVMYWPQRLTDAELQAFSK